MNIKWFDAFHITNASGIILTRIYKIPTSKYTSMLMFAFNIYAHYDVY